MLVSVWINMQTVWAYVCSCFLYLYLLFPFCLLYLDQNSGNMYINFAWLMQQHETLSSTHILCFDSTLISIVYLNILCKINIIYYIFMYNFLSIIWNINKCYLFLSCLFAKSYSPNNCSYKFIEWLDEKNKKRNQTFMMKLKCLVLPGTC